MSFLRDATNAYFEGKQPFEVARATALAVIAGYYGLKAFRAVRRDGLKKALTGLVMSAVKSVPGAKGAVEKEQKKILDKMESLIIPKEARQEKEVHTRLPALGRDRDALMSRFQEWSQKETARWERGQVSGGIYHGDQKMLAWLAQVYSLFALSNPLHPDVFPYIRKMESEVVSMTLGMFHGYNDDDEASGDAKDQKAAAAARPKRDYCGVMTSGGTESIIMAMKAYRDRAAEKGITEPEIIICVSAHAAFNKAAQYFKMKIVTVPVDPVTMAMDLNATKAAVTPNTVVVVGSAISFPHGILDPIEDLSALAVKHNIGLHVDSCLGGFLLPFMAKAGYPLPPFDFRLPGVTTISADTHKYGYAPKGSSVLMYSTKALRAFQYFVAPDWMGGIYASPSMAGSRPGGLIASTWAALVSMGEGGYVECTRAVMESATKIAAGVRAIPGLKVMGKPCASVVAFGSTDPALNVFKVGEAMGNRHWNLNTLQHPASVHICCTYMHRGAVADQFVKDLADAVAEVRANPDGFKNGSAAIYGLAESVPDTSLITDLAKGFLDTLYTAFPANAAAGQGAAAKPAAH